ncbi:MAG: T9SS type A sorting domain-containing protein [Bacteroidota bacterium]
MQFLPSKITLSLCLLLQASFLLAQTYTSFFTGDTTDIQSSHQSGIVLAGGGPDNDQAMQWMLQRADGGDVVVIRISGSDGYNNYFFSELGVAVNSVETIKFNSSSAAEDPYVNRRIREAEVLFIAGGDQSDYRDFWRDSPVAASLNYLLQTKGATVGGTSAGMAILSGVYYAPNNQSLISQEALSNPYHPNASGISNLPFLQAPYLSNVITDTHFQQRDREGRSVVFLARARELVGATALAISCNEATAVAIDESGLARVFGSFPAFNDYAFFLMAGCTNESGGPELMTDGLPFVWNQDGQALSVYRVPGRTSGANTFDLTNWTAGSGGSWQHWSVSNGQLTINGIGNAPTNCAPLSTNHLDDLQLQIYPLPAHDRLFINLNEASILPKIRLFDLHGRLVVEEICTSAGLAINQLPNGLYFLKIEGYNGLRKIVISQ